MHEVGEGWLMTSLSPSPLSVALLQASDSLAIFILSIPAGALADVVDRRRLGIATQVWLGLGALTLGVLTSVHWMTPATLIAVTFTMGVGAAFDAPLWQAIVAEVVPGKDLPRAVTLGALSINLARAFAPALGGLVVAEMGPSGVFFLNAATFTIVFATLARWHRAQPRSVAPAERWLGAVQSGLRFARHSPELLSAFARTATTIFGGICLLALLPSFARGTLGLGSLGFGVLLGCMGVGAVAAAATLPALGGKLSADVTLSGGTVVLGCALGALALAPTPAFAAPAMLVAGFSWMSIISSLNVAVQLATPSWVRARVSSVFMLVFQGALVLGSVAWGLLASRTSLRLAIGAAAVTTFVSVAVRLRFPLVVRAPDFSPAAWPKPQLVCDPPEDAGPVLVTVSYRVAASSLDAFIEAMADVERTRRRGGAYDWGLYRDASRAEVYVEAYSVDSWAEHLRQHERVTGDDLTAASRARKLTIDGTEVDIRHLISVTNRRLSGDGETS
jgi:MFS family permease